MKAAVYKKTGFMAVEEIPTPVPRADEVLVKVKYCGICGTDLHNYSFGITAPGRVLGHEWCGVITELGKGVKDFSIGDRVMLYKHKGGPAPPLRLNPRASYSSPSRRTGAYAEYLSAPTSRIIRVPDELSDEQAATLEPDELSDEQAGSAGTHQDIRHRGLYWRWTHSASDDSAG